MPEIGQTISHYRILEKIGVGGMGEVYLADDTTLDRKVALKFLPEVFTSDPERMARFEREAKLLASLNHPNIAAIYGLELAEGKRFLIMEYVKGETLQARISKGALPVEDALGVCRQIAEGLEAAHDRGVIHRDLKPANVMITTEENVKILDFGLAKALLDEGKSVDSSQSPTITEAMTQPGVVLGTAAYMSPEQAKGKAVDKRADIWAFGCILYECLSGKKAFEGETVTETLAAVIKEESGLEKAPAKVRLLLRQCLAKDRKNRLRDIGDAMAMINSTPELASKSASTKRQRLVLIWATASTILLLAITILTNFYHSVQELEERMIFQIAAPNMPGDCKMAISPDGRSIAFVASLDSEANSTLFIYRIGSETPDQVMRTEGATAPFWSPDSRSVGFFAEGMLKKVDVSDGLPVKICEASGGGIGGTWNHDGTIIFSRWRELRRVPATGGESVLIRTADESELNYGYPCFLPDGSNYIYAAWTTLSTGKIYLGSLDSKERVPLVNDATIASYSDPGYILFQSGRTLFVQPFDPQKLKFTGEPTIIAENIIVDSYGVGSFSASKNRLIFRSSDEANSQFEWFDRTGKSLGHAGEAGLYATSFELSPDEKQIAVTKSNNVWLIEWERDVSQQLTFDPANSGDVVWFPDGRIGFTSLRKGNADIYELNVEGDRTETPLLETKVNEWIEDCSQDGRYIAYCLGVPYQDIYGLSLFGDRETFPIVEAPGQQDEPHFSADGKWLAYGSDESGTWQVYVIPFPEGSPRKQISTNGGSRPRWRGDGKELFYLSLDGQMMAVEINTDNEIKPGHPYKLFDTELNIRPGMDQYDVTSDGDRFLLLKPTTRIASTPITIVLNWTKSSE